MRRCPIFCSLIVTLLAPATGALQPEPADALHVMTFNIRYGTADDHEDRWQNRRDLLFKIIRDQHPDVLGLQEALRSQLDELHAALPQYTEIGRGRDDGKTKGEYSAILFLTKRFDALDSGTFWFSDTPEKPGSITWGNACTRICTWARLHDKTTRRFFYLFNLHLDHISQPSREKSVSLLLERITHRAQNDPVLITGDFNTGETNPVIHRILSPTTSASSRQEDRTPRFIDTYRIRHPQKKDAGTFHAFKGAVRTGDKIDYIFAPAGAQIFDAAIIHDARNNHYPSDHFPVTAIVRLAPIQRAATRPAR